MLRIAFLVLFGSLIAVGAPSFKTWRSATENELHEVIPERVQVERERIETEFRTASGITDGNHRFFAGVVMITAGYSAELKYSNFLITQVPIKIDRITLEPGTYVFGWKHRSDDVLQVSLYEAQSGKLLGMVDASRTNRIGKIESFYISPPGERSQIQIGRFAMRYELLTRK
ncbi:MAG: hypothetical protein JO340_15880 [Acidobacteriaceae bacterium]|nr:hypothetical protein [Acidobacteriaceae bacterium]